MLRLKTAYGLYLAMTLKLKAMSFAKLTLFILQVVIVVSCSSKQKDRLSKPPNILFCIADDWSFPHAGAYGDEVIRTPNFDRVAREGVLFTKAYTAASSCSPSRAAILTGQEIYRLEAGGCLFGSLPSKFPVYTELLEANDYEVGMTGKGYGPANVEIGGWSHNPAGHAHQTIETEAPKGIRRTDYAANFKQFILERDSTKPFCFWYGASEPHRHFDYGIGARNGYDLDKIKVPAFLPSTEEVGNDLADYYYEVEWFDKHLGRIIDHLQEIGELDNTVIVVTSDNGMPFPRAKANCYNFGVQMPLAIRWGKKVKAGQIIAAPVSLTDIAPTFLEIANVPIPKEMTGQSLVPMIVDGKVEEMERPFVITALERHTLARPNNWGYPIRAIHMKDFTYIHNFEPDRWPGGDPDIDAWPQGFYGDVDDGASKTLFEEHPDQWPELFHLSFGKRPAEELFSIRDNIYNLNNLAENVDYQDVKEDLKEQLFTYLKSTDDPRMQGESPWDGYYFGGGKEWEK